MLQERQRPINPKISLCDAYPIRANLHQDLGVPGDISFNQSADRMEWKLNNTWVYSARSIYRVMIRVGMIKPLHEYTWKLAIPPTVRIFIYLLLKQKILTKDVMQRRNMGSDSGCEMCQNCPSKSALYLLFLCPTAVEAWYEMSAKMGYKLMVPNSSIRQIWTESRDQAKRRNKTCKREWEYYFACIYWHLWKRRNEKIFTGKMTSSRVLAERIVHEGRMWDYFLQLQGSQAAGNQPFARTELGIYFCYFSNFLLISVFFF